MAFEWNNECMEIPTIMNGFVAENRVFNCCAGIAIPPPPPPPPHTHPHTLVGYIKIYDFPATQAFLSRPINRHATLFPSNSVHVAWSMDAAVYTVYVHRTHTWRRSKPTHLWAKLTKLSYWPSFSIQSR